MQGQKRHTQVLNILYNVATAAQHFASDARTCAAVPHQRILVVLLHGLRRARNVLDRNTVQH